MSTRDLDIPAHVDTATDEPPRAVGRSRALFIAALMIPLTVALVVFSDRDGYEGDDLSVLSAVFDLDSAKQGDLFLYRYAWQPLAYDFSAWIYRVFDTPDAVFALAPLCGAASLWILICALARTSRRLANPLVLFSFLVVFPELFYAGMFFNTTVLGMPMAAVAVYLLTVPPRSMALPRAALIGAMLALATLMRFDFLLMCPFFAAWLWIERRSPLEIVCLVSGSFAVVGLAAAFGMVDPRMLLDTLRVHHEEVNLGITEAAYRWGWKDNVKVIAVTMHPIAWAVLLIGTPGRARDFARRHGGKSLALLALSIVPMLYPMTSFVSVKYVIPLLMLLPFVIQSITEHVSDRASVGAIRLVSGGVIALAVAVALVSVEPSKRPPFLRATLATPKVINTHDGPRTFGAFAVSLREAGRDDSSVPLWQAADRLLRSLDGREGHDLWIVASDSSFNNGRASWRYLRTLLARRGLHGRRVSPHTFRYDVGEHAVFFAIPSKDEAERKQALAPAALRLDLSDPKLTEIEADQLIKTALEGPSPR